MVKLIAASSLLLLVGCSTDPVPLPGIAPFRGLECVEIGMTAGDLRDTRTVEFAPYTGLKEESPDRTVLYHISSVLTEHNEPRDRAAIDAVSVVQDMPGRPADAGQEYLRLKGEWTGELGDPECVYEGADHGTSVWREGELELTGRWTAEMPPGTLTQVIASAATDSTNLTRCRTNLATRR